MTNTTVCSDCQADISITDISCGNCGKAAPFQKNSEKPPVPKSVNHSSNTHSNNDNPYLTTQIKKTYTPGEHLALDFSIHNIPANTQPIVASFSGILSQTTNSKTFQANKIAFDAVLPNTAGDIRLILDISYKTLEHIEFNYQCSITLSLIQHSSNAQSSTYNINFQNDKGVLDAGGFALPYEPTNPAPNFLDKKIPLTLLNKSVLESFTRGKIIFKSKHKVKVTHLYATPEIILGRQTEKKPVDIDLKCFPNNEDNQYRANRISRHHCIIQLQQQKFEIRDVSTWGTQINQIRIKKEEWHIINNNDIIQIADINVLTKELTGALQLKATTLPHGLLLERIDNAAQEENYLILKPETKPVPNHSNDSPIIFHHEGGFHLLSKNGQSHYLSIDKKINIDKSQFTFHNT